MASGLFWQEVSSTYTSKHQPTSMLKWASLAISGEILELASRTLMSSSPQPGAMKFYNKRVYPPSLCTTKPLPGCKGAKSEDFSLLLWEEVLCPTHRARTVTVIIRDPRDPGSPFSWSLNWSYPVLLLPTLPVTLPHCKVDEGVCVCVLFFFNFLLDFLLLLSWSIFLLGTKKEERDPGDR